ncbi:SEC14-like protein 5 [Seminavis robusta]|uniref:SEC14-like protein 5 n=1 Tax=Seminavis robusta TaxID=568900 RepID=A0A9N8ETL2_9STRA|nr:SEC14-like protein 5 [Seminavis robusta]|eukprot:Sro1915_g305110.1 SEC14-like protein 5 (389) ;mRNA; f:6097-7390
MVWRSSSKSRPLTSWPDSAEINDTTAGKISTVFPFGMSYKDRWRPEEVQECIAMWGLNREELSKLLELKERVSDRKDHWANGPFELVRFVREHTCYGDVNKMEQRVRQSTDWRAENGLDEVLETFCPRVVVYRFPAAVMQGVDKEGGVVAVLRNGDPLGLIQRFGRDEVIRSLFWGIEFAIRGPWQLDFYQKYHQRPGRVTAVLDLKGLNRRHYHPSLILLAQKLMDPLEENYPHVIKKILVVNAPAIFDFVWGLVKHLVAPHLRLLMEVAKESETQDLLSRYIDLEVLPDYLVPGIGQGKPVRGLNPDWVSELLPPQSDHDSERVPLVYGPKKSASSYYTTTSIGSSCSFEHMKKSYHNPRRVRTVTKPLFKGIWKQGSINTVQIMT